MATARTRAPVAAPEPGSSMQITRNPSLRVRQAVRDNSVSLLARLQHKVDLRNTDRNRLTSLSWAAIEGSLEVFEWLLLDYGHDDQELSRDADSNTILHLLASIPSPPTLSPHTHLLMSSPLFPPKPSTRSLADQIAISLRMTHLYHTLFPFLLDWSNSGGKTALHVAAQAGNTAFINLLCDFGADVDLTDLQGNTPLHYASAWGHVETIRVLLERGCQYSSRNYEGFTAADFAYSNNVMGSLQTIAREMYEERRTRRKAEAAEARAGSSQGVEGRFRSGSVSTRLSVGSGSAVSSNLPTGTANSSRRPSNAAARPAIYDRQDYGYEPDRRPSPVLILPPPQPPSHPTSSGRPVAFRSPSMPTATSSSSSSPMFQQHPPLPTALGPVVGSGSVAMRRTNSAQTGSSTHSAPPVPPPTKRSTSGRGTPI